MAALVQAAAGMGGIEKPVAGVESKLTFRWHVSMHWHGEFAFGDVWLAFRGASADNRLHAHAAVQLVAGGTDVVVADDTGRKFAGPGWAIRSDVRHALRPTPSLVLVLVEPQARLADRLLDRLATSTPIAPLPADLVAVLTQPVHVREIVRNLEQPLAGTTVPCDPRLAEAMRHLERRTSGDAVAAAAAHCGLSPSRLRALSQQHFGVPLSKLVMWKKVRTACLALARGSNLVEAALEAGFADQAHLTRTMSSVIGLTPGEARSVAP